MPPIRTVQRWLVPPKSAEDWQRIAFQPMLYLGLWTGSVVAACTGIPPAFLDGHDSGVAWVWASLSLASPPAALASLWLISATDGRWKYRGLWLRLAADVGQLTAILVYMLERTALGGLGPYPFGLLMSVMVFCAHLVMRDVKRVYAVERLARRISHGEP